MTKAVFYIKDKVQDVGYRVWIMEKILNSKLEGTAQNMPDGSIQVLLEGEKEKIIQFYEKIRKEKPELVENPTAMELIFDETLDVPDALRSSQALQMDQFEKSVYYLKGLGNKVDGLGNKTEAGFDKLSNQTEAGFDKLSNQTEAGFDKLSNQMEAGFDKLSNQMEAGFDKLSNQMETGFDSLGTKIDALPDKITTKITEKLDELPDKITTKITEKLDELPEKIAKAIKS
jgi:acylphosphatase